MDLAVKSIKAALEHSKAASGGWPPVVVWAGPRLSQSHLRAFRLRQMQNQLNAHDLFCAAAAANEKQVQKSGSADGILIK